MDFIGEFQGTAATFGDIDRVFLGWLQVPVNMRVLRMSLNLCGCERPGRSCLSAKCHTLSHAWPDLAPTYAAMLEQSSR